jgi:hypothetical protein
VPFLFANRATSTLALPIDATQTSIPLAPGTGARFPAPGFGDRFRATIIAATGESEIVECTARSVDTLTVVRGMEGTTPRSFPAGSRVELRLTAGVVSRFLQSGALPPLEADLDLGGNTLVNVDWGPITAFVKPNRTITAGTGLTGGGTLASDVTLAAVFASEAEMDAGVVTNKVVSPALAKRIRDQLEPSITPGYTRTEPLPVSLPALVTLAHGLAAVPMHVAVWLQARVANNGYSAGMRVPSYAARRADNLTFPTVAVDATNIKIAIPSTLKMKTLAADNTVFDVTSAEWELFIQAWKPV